MGRWIGVRSWTYHYTTVDEVLRQGLRAGF
jgi:hypothetical protein